MGWHPASGWRWAGIGLASGWRWADIRPAASWRPAVGAGTPGRERRPPTTPVEDAG
ncbi:MAG: hypothetical protein ACXV5Q_03155 [Frankiaceae bacterium]